MSERPSSADDYTDVYLPPRPHDCRELIITAVPSCAGSIRRCNGCGRYWYRRPGFWERVRWFDFTKKRRIRQWEHTANPTGDQQ